LAILGGSPVSWKTKKQVTVLRSFAEAEYRSMAAVTSELVWLKSFLASLGIFHKQLMHLFCDNRAALHITRNPVFHDPQNILKLVVILFVKAIILEKLILITCPPKLS